MHAGLLMENMKKRDHLGRPGHRWEKILKRILKKQDGKV
jgi:hypothetical protein